MWDIYVSRRLGPATRPCTWSQCSKLSSIAQKFKTTLLFNSWPIKSSFNSVTRTSTSTKSTKKSASEPTISLSPMRARISSKTCETDTTNKKKAVSVVLTAHHTATCSPSANQRASSTSYKCSALSSCTKNEKIDPKLKLDHPSLTPASNSTSSRQARNRFHLLRVSTHWDLARVTWRINLLWRRNIRAILNRNGKKK